MLTGISPRKNAMVGRIILQIVLLGIIGYFSYIIIFPNSTHLFHDESFRRWLILFLCLGFSIKNIYELFYLPFRVIIDDEFKTLEIRYAIGKPKIIWINDIDFYSDTVSKSNQPVTLE